MKKFIKLCLLFTLCFNTGYLIKATDGYSISAVETAIYNLDGASVRVNELVQLYDIEGNPTYFMATFKDGGYAILTHNYVVSEYSLETTSNPYSKYIGNEKEKMIYGGPSNYYTENELINVFSDYDSYERLKNINTEVLSQSNTSRISSPTKWSGLPESRFKNYSWINYEGWCGSYATAIMLAYCYDWINTKFLPKDLTGYTTKDSNGLVDKLAEYIERPGGTLANNLKQGLTEFYDYYGISNVRISANISSTWGFVVQRVDQNYPIVVGLSELASSPYGNHWVTVYAYGTDSSNKGYYKANVNWKQDYEEKVPGYKATILATWTIGTVYVY